MRAAIRSAAKETRGQTARSTRIQSIIPSVAIPLSGRDPPFGRIFRTITGKVPARIGRQLERENALKTLQRDLQKAVADENYESAAQIRDQLRQLETSNES